MALANCQYGFDTGALAGFQAMQGFLMVFGYKDPKSANGYNIETKPQQLIASCLNIGTILGVMFTGLWAKYFGRRPAIWLASVISFVGLGVQIGVTNLGGLCVGRMLIGISNAFFITFSNVYIVEVTPPHLRAVVASFFGIWVNIGGILGTVVNYETSTIKSRLAYQIPLSILYSIPLVLSLLVVFLPESPRWLLVNGQREEAEKALASLRGNSLEPEFLKEELEEMIGGIEEEKSLARSAAFLDMFKASDLRRTVICIGVTLSHSSSGVWLWLAYGTYFYQMAGVHTPFIASIWTTCANMIGSLGGMYLMFKVFGRRSMMLSGCVASALCMLAPAIAYSVAPGTNACGKVIIAFGILYAVFYTGLSGIISWPIASEMVSSRLRVYTVSFATGINYFFSWLVSFCSPYFINSNALNWGARYCYIWAASNLITFVFFYFVLPEVKGRSLEEIDELFQNRVSVREFPRYQCLSAVRAHEVAVQEMAKEHKPKIREIAV